MQDDSHDDSILSRHRISKLLTRRGFIVCDSLDRFHLVIDSFDRLPQTGDRGIYLKQKLKDKLIEHKQEIDKYGEDLPEIRNWKWSPMSGGKPA
jgi:phosphoketolase